MCVHYQLRLQLQRLSAAAPTAESSAAAPTAESSAAATLAALAPLAALAAAGYRAVCGSGCGLLPGRQRQQSVDRVSKLPRHSARVRAGLRGDR